MLFFFHYGQQKLSFKQNLPRIKMQQAVISEENLEEKKPISRFNEGEITSYCIAPEQERRNSCYNQNMKHKEQVENFWVIATNHQQLQQQKRKGKRRFAYEVGEVNWIEQNQIEVEVCVKAR